MKKVIILALVALAAWTAWKKYPELMAHRPSHEAIVENESDETISRVRLEVGGQTFVREEIAAGAKVVFPFRVNRDATFHLIWDAKGGTSEMQWRGGSATAGPIVARHRMTVHGDGGVIYRSEPVSSAAP